MKIINPSDKNKPKLNQEYYDKAIRELNTKTNYPIKINIGKHIMNSYTQDMIEKHIRECGFYSVRRGHNSDSGYEALYVDYKYDN